MKMMVFICLLLSLSICFDDAYPQYTHRNRYMYDDDENVDDGQPEPGDLIQYNGIYMYGGYAGGYGG